MAVHWEVPFRSLDGTSYAVRIYDDHYAGPTPISLVGAATPFVTQEDDDEDAFIPIRTQTGYLRIFDDGNDAVGNTFDWRDLIPTGALDRRVEVVTGSTVKWTGYIQPQSFSGEIYNGAQEREFPVCDMLTMLKCWDIVPTDYQSSNFARLLLYIFDGVLDDFSEFVFNGGSDIIDWLKLRVMWSNFAEYDNDGNMQAKYNCYEMLEEVCKFFGWTCRYGNNNLYFELTGGNSTAWRQLTKSSLQNLANGSGYSVTFVTTTVKTAFPGNFASMENSETYLQGVRKVKVEADVGKVSTIIEYPSQEIWNYYKAETVIKSGTYYFEFEKLEKEFVDKDYYFKDVTLSFRSNTTGNSRYYGCPWIYCNSIEENPHDLNFNNVVYIEKIAPTNTVNPTMVRLVTTKDYWLNDGIIVISGKTYIDDVKDGNWITYTAAGWLLMSLQVGGKYAVVVYDNTTGKPYISEWRDSFSGICAFEVNTGGENDDPNDDTQGVGKILSTRLWSDPYPSYDGFGLPLSNLPAGGRIELNIIGFHDSHPPAMSPNNMRGVRLQDLKIEFFRKNTEAVPNEAETNKYTSTGNQLFFNEREVKTIFTCDNNNQFGTAIVTNPNGKYCQTLNFPDRPASAGQHLADRIAEFGSKTRRVMEIEVTGGTIASYNPTYIYRTNEADYAPIAISRDWRNDIFTVKLLEVT